MIDTDKDVMAITKVINLYGLGMDTQRWDMFDRLFTDDVHADYGEGSHWQDLLSQCHSAQIERKNAALARHQPGVNRRLVPQERPIPFSPPPAYAGRQP